MELAQSIIFFDGVCNLCNGFVQFVLKHETNSKFQFCSLQSEFATQFFKQKQFDLTQIDSVIVYENEQIYVKSEAAFKVIETLKWPYKVLLIFKIFPKLLSNFIYDFIAKIRYKTFGKTNQCWVIREQYKQRFL